MGYEDDNLDKSSEELQEDGRTFFRSNLFNEAISCFEKSIKLEPDNVFTWFSQGCAYFELKDYELAHESFKNVKILDPNWGLGWYKKGEISLRIKKRNRQALNDFIKTTELDPKWIWGWIARRDEHSKLRQEEKFLDCEKIINKLSEEQGEEVSKGKFPMDVFDGTLPDDQLEDAQYERDFGNIEWKVELTEICTKCRSFVFSDICLECGKERNLK